MSHFSQMAGLTVQNFLSAATGIALAARRHPGALRAPASPRSAISGSIMTRATLYVLLPLSIVVALAFVAMGLPQTLDASVTATTLEGANQTIALGPVASQEAIKQLGTNGGGFFNVNAAHPFENPTAWSNYLNIFAMLSISAALVYAFGQMVGDRRQGWALHRRDGRAADSRRRRVIYWAETSGNPILTALGVDPALGNMEGKEVRFGQAMTAALCGGDHRPFRWRRQRHARLVHGARRPRADVPDPAWRGPAGRRRLRSLRHDRLRAC